MKSRVSKKQGRRQQSIGRRQLDNVHAAREIRRIEAELARRGYSPADVERALREMRRGE